MLKTTAKFVRDMVKSKYVCSAWKDTIKKEFREAFKEKTIKKKTLVKLGDKFLVTRNANCDVPVFIGHGVAPTGLKDACLLLNHEVEVKVEGRVISFYKNETHKEFAHSDDTVLIVSKEFLDRAYAVANDTVKGILEKEFGKEAIEACKRFNFADKWEVSTSSLEKPMYIALGFAPDGLERQLISLNEVEFDVHETKDTRGNRAFYFVRKS